MLHHFHIVVVLGDVGGGYKLGSPWSTRFLCLCSLLESVMLVLLPLLDMMFSNLSVMVVVEIMVVGIIGGAAQLPTESPMNYNTRKEKRTL